MKNVLLLLFGLVCMLPAEGQISKLSEGDRFYDLGIKFVTARNETDPQKRLEIISSIFSGSSDSHQSIDQFINDLQKIEGTFDLHSLYSMGGGSAIHLIGQERRSGLWMRYQLGLGSDGKIGLLAQTPSQQPRAIPDVAINSIEMKRFITEQLDELNQKFGFSGAILISKDGQKLFSKSLGYASDEEKIPLTSQTALSMASGSKMFTAVLIAIAVEQGLLRWDQQIHTLIPDLCPDTWDDITIKHLLTHTSGLPEYWDERFDRKKDPISNTQDFLPFFQDRPLQFSPGEKAIYTNTNFIVLGLILEAVFDESFTNILTSMILEPIQMNHSYAGIYQNAVEYYVPGGPGEWFNVSPMNPFSSPAGGVHSTPEDLNKFVRALLDDKLISERTFTLMTSKHADFKPGGYGLGFEVQSDLYYGHGGRGPGHFFECRVYPESGLVYIIMTNRETPQFLDLKMTIESIIQQETKK